MQTRNGERALTVALTGGGTAGHVMPHLALLPEMRRRGWRLFYVGSRGMEYDLMRAAGIDYEIVSVGKLRRYITFANVRDAWRVLRGFFEAFQALRRRRPDVVFSKGGYVSVPVCLAAWSLRIPIVTHESDFTPGLATRIIARVATRVLCSFSETEKHIPGGKGQTVGSPIRAELFAGERLRGLLLCGFTEVRQGQVLLVMGGSQGAQRINDALLRILPNLMDLGWSVIHLTGKGKSIAFAHERYRAFEFIGSEMGHILAAADLVVSRAGANSIFELVALRKPMLLIPLKVGSRGDQIDNAAYFAKHGWAYLMDETKITPETFLAELLHLHRDAATIRTAQMRYESSSAIDGAIQSIAASAAI